MIRPSTFLMACLVMAAAALPLRADADPGGDMADEGMGSLDGDLPAPRYLAILGLALSIDLDAAVEDSSVWLESRLPPAADDGPIQVLTSPLEDAVQEAVPAAVFDRTEPPIGRWLLSIPVVWF